jgi:hypothetical protein
MRILLTVLLLTSSAFGQVLFEDYFHDRTLRVDYYHIGNASEEILTLDHLKEGGPWAGNLKNLLDPSGLGRYAVKVYSIASNALIFSRGFDSYFGEYATTAPAKEGVKRTFHETVMIPFPKQKILLVFEKRNRQNLPAPIATFEIDPDDYHIIRESTSGRSPTFEVLHNGDPHEKVDLAIVADGYTAKEEVKFRKDLDRYVDVFFSEEPYKHLKSFFNIYGVFTVSPESGVDEPRQRSYRATALGCTFNSLDSDRYLLTEENRLLNDLAAQVPHDALIIMVNSKRYGGGGIYRLYSVFTSDGNWSSEVFLHEFGHAFAGLGDEYYTSDVAYEEFYPKGVEPTEPNLTALLDPSRVKWKDLLTPGLPVPTPWGQTTYDSLGAAREELAKEKGAHLAKLKDSGASAEELKRAAAPYDEKLKTLNGELTSFMEHHLLRGKVGVFQGGGYLPKGIYRPTVNSLMNQFNKSDRSFYPVNERAIERMVRWLSGE